MARGNTVSEPRSAVEIAEDLKTIRHLIGIADQLAAKMRCDLGIARVRLAELERELASQGVGS